jgi:hypothetical protein
VADQCDAEIGRVNQEIAEFVSSGCMPVWPKAPQVGQVREPYSTSLSDAFGLPIR